MNSLTHFYLTAIPSEKLDFIQIPDTLLAFQKKFTCFPLSADGNGQSEPTKTGPFSRPRETENIPRWQINRLPRWPQRTEFSHSCGASRARVAYQILALFLHTYIQRRQLICSHQHKNKCLAVESQTGRHRLWSPNQCHNYLYHCQEGQGRKYCENLTLRLKITTKKPNQPHETYRHGIRMRSKRFKTLLSMGVSNKS